VRAGIRNKEAFRWQNINENYLIDTKDIVVKDNEIKLWVQLKGYSKLRLILDCKDFTYKKEFDHIISQSKAINNQDTTYLIANQLCFLTGIDGFYMEFNRPKWARTIIKNATQNKSKVNSNQSSETKTSEISNFNTNNQYNSTEPVKESPKKKIFNIIRE
tara:strand:- start:4 stop:483 length:480 start_codon:yes stop_codon:yes gene_type:complete